MTQTLNFDGDVIVVTGGAGGLGRAQCLELARRGARVVVNDLGGDLRGGGADASLAQGVVDEILAAGGEAVASTDSVSDDAGPDRIVQTALETYGRLDAYVSNAAILRNQRFENISDDDWDAVMAVDLRAVFRGLRSAYRVMMERGGRLVVMTSTAGLAGSYAQANYAAAKMGVIGLIRSAAWEGRQYGIQANLVAPGATDTRATKTTRNDKDPAYADRPADLQMKARSDLPPDLSTADKVAPLIARLVHSSCPSTGRVYAAMGGVFHRFGLAASEPAIFPGGAPTVEDLVARWDEIEGAGFPRELDQEVMLWGADNYADAFAQIVAARDLEAAK